MQVFTFLSTFLDEILICIHSGTEFLTQILIFKSSGVNCKPLIFLT